MHRELPLALCGLVLVATNAVSPALAVGRVNSALGSPGAAVARTESPARTGAKASASLRVEAKAKLVALGSEHFQKQHEAARAALVQRLVPLAGWCNLKALFEERDRVYRLILQVDPNHSTARQTLKHIRNSDGTWKEPTGRGPVNQKTEALPQFAKKRSEAVAPFSEALLAMLEEEEEVAPELRTAVHAEILSFDPDDERIRALQGDVRLGESWVMAETAAGKQRRPEIKRAAEKWRNEPAETETTEPNELEKSLADAWTAAVRTRSVRVLGTVEEEEVLQIAQACEGALELVSAVFATEAKLPKDLTFYVLTPEDRDGFVDRLPGLTDAQRAEMKQMAGAGVGGSPNVFVADEDPAKRLDCAVRHTLIHALRETFGVGTKQGWVWEGLGLYLTRELVGTRLTWFVLASPGVEQDSLQGNLLTPETNWMAEGLGLLGAPHPPEIAEVVAKDLASLGLEDMLVGYVLAAYLVEGRPEEAGKLLSHLGRGLEPAKVFEITLQQELPELQARLKRWLEERK